MTPERLEAIRADVAGGYVGAPDRGVRQFTAALGDLEALLDYVDLLHEDLRLTRAERDAEKHKCLEHRKALARQSREHTAEVLAWDALAVDTRAKAWDEGWEAGADWGLWTERTYSAEPSRVNPYNSKEIQP